MDSATVAEIIIRTETPYREHKENMMQRSLFAILVSAAVGCSAIAFATDNSTEVSTSHAASDTGSTQTKFGNTYRKGIATGTGIQSLHLDGDEFQNRAGIVTANGAPDSRVERHEYPEFKTRVTTAAGNMGAYGQETDTSRWKSHIVTASGVAPNGVQ